MRFASDCATAIRAANRAVMAPIRDDFVSGGNRGGESAERSPSPRPAMAKIILTRSVAILPVGLGRGQGEGPQRHFRRRWRI